MTSPAKEAVSSFRIIFSDKKSTQIYAKNTKKYKKNKKNTKIFATESKTVIACFVNIPLRRGL
jgi:hypothetical protein